MHLSHGYVLRLYDRFLLAQNVSISPNYILISSQAIQVLQTLWDVLLRYRCWVHCWGRPGRYCECSADDCRNFWRCIRNNSWLSRGAILRLSTILLSVSGIVLVCNFDGWVMNFMNIRSLHDFLDGVHFISLVGCVMFQSQAWRFRLTELSGTTAAGEHAHI